MESNHAGAVRDDDLPDFGQQQDNEARRWHEEIANDPDYELWMSKQEHDDEIRRQSHG